MPRLLRQHLQLAVAVRDADRADVIALGEEQFEDHPAVVLQALGVGRDLHAFFHARDASRQQLVLTLDLDQAEAAGADVGEAVQVAQAWNEDAVLPRDVENGFVLASAHDRGRRSSAS